MWFDRRRYQRSARARFQFRIQFRFRYDEANGTRTQQDRNIDGRSRCDEIVVHQDTPPLIERDIQAVVREFEKRNFIVLQCLSEDRAVHRDTLNFTDPIAEGRDCIDDCKAGECVGGKDEWRSRHLENRSKKRSEAV